MRVAFKEWAVVVDALGSGQQIVILRKGGISEGRRGFQVDHAEFFLYPSLFHQQREAILEPWRDRFDQLAAGTPDPAVLSLDYFAHVVSWCRLESLETVQNLRGQHILRDEVIAERFDWKNDKNIHAMAVRVFRLPATVQLPVLPSYSGCKSWIDLEVDIATDGAVPVLSKEAFNEKLDLFQAAVQSGAQGHEPDLTSA